MKRPPVRSMEDMASLIREFGILPFFPNAVKGWSLKEHTDPSVWFTDRDGPWEWKGPLASERICVYGKFIRGKAAFVTPEWFRELANLRRDGYDWEAREDEGIAPYREILLMRYICAHPGCLSKDAARECGFSRGYDAVLTSLEMQTYVVISDFRYSVSRTGIPYGWGNAVIDTAERWLGEDAVAFPEEVPGDVSLARMTGHLTRLMPDADADLIAKLLA